MTSAQYVLKVNARKTVTANLTIRASEHVAKFAVEPHLLPEHDHADVLESLKEGCGGQRANYRGHPRFAIEVCGRNSKGQHESGNCAAAQSIERPDRIEVMFGGFLLSEERGIETEIGEREK